MLALECDGCWWSGVRGGWAARIMSAKKQAQLLTEVYDLRHQRKFDAIERPLNKYLAICKVRPHTH